MSLAFHVNSCIAASAQHASASPTSAQQGLVQELSALGDEQTSKAAERLPHGSTHPEHKQCITGAETTQSPQHSRPVDVTASASGAHQLQDSGQMTHAPLSAPRKEHGSISSLNAAEPSSLVAAAAVLQRTLPAASASAAAHAKLPDSKASAGHTEHEAEQEQHTAHVGQAMQRSALQKAAVDRHKDTGKEQSIDQANKQLLQLAETGDEGQNTQSPPAHSTAAPSGNAFAHMMQKQKERAQTWTFYLGRADDGCLFWHFWRDVKGSRPLPDILTHCSGMWYV